MSYNRHRGYSGLPTLDANGMDRSNNSRSRGPSPAPPAHQPQPPAPSLPHHHGAPVPPYDPAPYSDRPFSPHFSSATSNVSSLPPQLPPLFGQPSVNSSIAPSPSPAPYSYNSYGNSHSPSPAYVPLPPSTVMSPPPSSAASPIVARPHLPHFQAALARARGESPAPLPVPPPQPQRAQPTPSYLPPPDPNHPDLSVGFTQSSTVRYAMGYNRERSRSPSPGFDDSVNYGRVPDVEQALLAEQPDGPQLHQPVNRPPYSQDLNGDISLMGGPNGNNGSRDSLYKPPIEDEFESVPLVEGQQEEKDTQHFGPAPTQRIGRRGQNARRIKQKVTLDDTGMFAVEMPIPTRLAQFLPVKGVAEQRSTRYTAVTTDPNDFPASGVLLRQNRYNPPRQTELFIVITMYNEDAILFCRTLYGVMKNIAHLCHRKNSRTWGANAWQKVVVCIVADGRKNVNPRVLDCLAALGVYQEGAMTSKVKDRPVTAHVFEYTTSFALDPDLQFKYPDKGTIVPCQIIFCMKEKNAKKINSHRWFFNAFAPLLQPNVCILLDVGTMPGTKSIYHLWKAFDINSNVGGACGEIATFKGKAWKLLLNPLVAAQCFEYKMSNILDKPMESLFGYCAVLPGAFSAYRYIALLNDSKGQGPLASYFKGENLHGSGASTFSQNMYLAEDRVLCFEIVAKPNANWVLKYVKSAIGETDCPDTLPEFIGQRRRWLNGSFFAALYAMIHVKRIWQSGHSFWRRVALMIEFFYNALSLVFGWFAMGNFYIFFVILTNALAGPEFHLKGISVFNTILQYLYIAALVACFIFGLGNRPQGSPWKYRIVVYFFAIITFYMLICGVLCVVAALKTSDSAIFSRMVVSLIATYGIFVISSILALDPWHIFTCFLQYLLFTPTYTNVLQIYAYSNLHDLSWGTKGSDTVEDELGAVKGVGKNVEVAIVSEQVDIDSAYQDALDNIRIKREKVDDLPKRNDSGEQKQKDIYANFRTDLLLIWTLSNALLASVILAGVDASNTFTGSGTRTTVYMLIILVFVAAMAAFRFICATLYLIIRLFTGV